jgi:hypothetical protein
MAQSHTDARRTADAAIRSNLATLSASIITRNAAVLTEIAARQTPESTLPGLLAAADPTTVAASGVPYAVVHLDLVLTLPVSLNTKL